MKRKKTRIQCDSAVLRRGELLLGKGRVRY
jgi:hypothetical protein